MKLIIKYLFILIAFLTLSCNSKPENSISPNIDFSYDIDSNGVVVFKNLSESKGNFRWDFGDSTFSTDFSPNHQYFINGEYKVNLSSEGVNMSKNVIITNSNKISSVQEVSDYFGSNYSNNSMILTNLGEISYIINEDVGKITYSQTRAFYNINSKYLYLSHWGVRTANNKLILVEPEGRIEKNEIKSFLKPILSFRNMRILNNSSIIYLEENQGVWEFTKLVKNRLTGKYTGKFISTSADKTIYNVQFNFTDIYVPFTLTDVP